MLSTFVRMEFAASRTVYANTFVRMEMYQPYDTPSLPPPNGHHQALTLEADRVFKRTVKEDHDFNEFQQQREKVTS